MTGYLTKEYARSFSEQGEPFFLAASGGWGLKIKNKLINPFPFFKSKQLNYANLYSDIDYNQSYGFINGKTINSMELILDPLLYKHNTTRFSRQEYKLNYINELKKPLRFAHHHWDKIREFAKAGGQVRNVTLYNTVNRTDYAKLFYEMYSRNSPKKGLDFSENCFISQFNTPGILLFAAEYENKIAGMMMFYLMGENVYYHLATFPNILSGASYACLYDALCYFKQLGLENLMLGSDEEAFSSSEELSEWKAGWSTREVYNYKLEIKL